MTDTHTVFNQSKPLTDYNMFLQDAALVDLVQRYGADWAKDRLESFGAFTGSSLANTLAIQANVSEPMLKTHDRFGNRLDEVDFHPSYHELMKTAIAFGLHSLPWEAKRDGSHVARAAMLYMSFQNEAGHCCPISMTYSVVPALRKQPDLAAVWEPRLLSNVYDGRFLPSELKSGITIGMGMTEKQGGSDVRANTTRALPAGEPGPGKEYKLTGHKWFCSAPMSDAFLILAQTEKGLSCFLVPRWKPDGSKNSLHIQRLKEKLGNRSNASSELEFVDALGWLVGEEGRGVATIIEMVNHTRLDCMLGASALMRQATAQALNHAMHRAAFGKKLIDQPLMQSVLADLALESEAAIRLTMRLARAYDQCDSSAGEALFKRLGSAIAKYWVCKRTPMHVAEALECFGGNGYVEEGPMPRLFRESPLLGIWEGSGNVICLDVLRAVSKEPESLSAVLSEITRMSGKNRTFDSFVKELMKDVAALKALTGATTTPAASTNDAETQAKAQDAKTGHDNKPEKMAKTQATDAVLTRSQAAQKKAQAAQKKAQAAQAKAKAAQAPALEQSARRFVERLALALQGALMLEQTPSYVADTFIAARMGPNRGFAFGNLPARARVKAIVERAMIK